MLAADALDEVADSLIGHFVDRARRSGASWTAIGRSMGVSKQAAQKRFATKAPGETGGVDPQQGFDQFTQRARNVVVTAQNEAAGARNAEIGTGHLVLGLLGDPASTASRALAFGVAARLGSDQVGTEHVLLALLDLEDGDGLLTSAGATRDATTAAVQPG